MRINEISIQCWNVFGIFSNLNGFTYSKLHDPDFLKQTCNNHIFGLVETQHTSDDIDSLQILDFKCFQACRKKERFGRKHGGLAVYVHNSIARGVSKLPTNGADSILIRLNKEFFNLSKDVVIIFAYCSPQNSSYLVRTQIDPFEDLEDKIRVIEDDTDILVMGDLNARTGVELDFIEHDNDQNIPTPENMYETDSPINIPRGNMDRAINKYGQSLLELCKTVPLRICNGRKLGDILGSFTCFKYNGQSAVDYCLASPTLLSEIAEFKVHTFLPTFSDHCAISAKLRTNFLKKSNEACDYEYIQKPTKVKWNKTLEQNFIQTLESDVSKNIINDMFSTGILPEQGCIDSATDILANFLVDAAERINTGNSSLKFSGPPKNQSRNWKFRKKKKSVFYPKWHDESCLDLKKKISFSAYLLKKEPKNSYIKGKIISETKAYKKLVKSKHKQYIDQMFTHLDSIQHSDQHGYMQLVKSLRQGSFGKTVPADSDHVPPEDWYTHFQSLLGPKVPITPETLDIDKFIDENIDSFSTELDRAFSKSDFLESVATLENNKSSSFDKVTNEMLKAGRHYVYKPILNLFNKILDSSIYPSSWKLDILTPLHKSGDKSDTNNFRGIAVSSCFGKLFNKMLQKRFEKLAQKNHFISPSQGSGKAGSRTADHLLVLRFLVDKYVLGQGKKLYSCFVDLQKAFDTVPRSKLFYKLLKEYSVGGKFLKILQEIYRGNKMFVKTNNGLLQPFETTIGVKQGCVLSPILFNIFIDKINEVFDESCAPIKINNLNLNCLLWADDLVIFSQTAEGLQNSIDKMKVFYKNLGLKINVKKTKIMIFNKRGLSLKGKYNFFLGGEALEVTDQYQYLGLKIRPSGAMGLAVEELNTKATKAWFSISKILYKHKRLEVRRSLQIFDSLIVPISTYGAEFWLPHSLPAKSFRSFDNLLNCWENFVPEKINQKCCRLILGVHKKASRLAVLGELGRHPLLIKSLSHSLNYKLNLNKNRDSDSILGNVMVEMNAMADQSQDCWLTRVQKIEKLLKIQNLPSLSRTSGKIIFNDLKEKFETFWKRKLTEEKIGADNINHNKLRTYSNLKNNFNLEPYLNLVRNRTQRMQITRLRISAHNLNIERGRYKGLTVAQRICKYCPSSNIDDEFHFLNKCKTFLTSRNCLFKKFTALEPTFETLTENEKFKRLLNPKTAQETKIVNKFINIMFDWREKIDKGFPITNLSIYFAK